MKTISNLLGFAMLVAVFKVFSGWVLLDQTGDISLSGLFLFVSDLAVLFVFAHLHGVAEDAESKRKRR